MTQLTRDLLADGLLVELENTPSHGGRPARQLGLAANAGRAVGVKVVADHVAFVEVGIGGSVIRSASEPYDASAPTAVTQLTVLLARFIAGGGSLPLLGVGVGVPGTVEQQGEGVVDSTQLGWNQVPLGAALQRTLGLPVLIENNVNALTMAERLFGRGRNHRDFLVVTIGTGVGAGIVADGVVFRGHAGGAGEIGHVPVADGPTCQCGNEGCLEAVVGERALVRTARRRGIISSKGDISALLAAADRGDKDAQALYSEAGHFLGKVLGGVVNVLNPEIVIVLGEGVAAWEHWSFGFEPSFRASLVPAKRGVGVAVESWQDESWAQGAAAIVLSTPFDLEGLSGDQGRLVRERLVEQAAPSVELGKQQV
ncbi:MAG: ROK family protein [Rhodoglobus sp.]